MDRLTLATLFAAVAITPAFAADDLALQEFCTVKLAQAHTIALAAAPGTIIETDVEKTLDGKYFWDVDVKQASGEVKEVHIDGATGSVLKIEVDDDDD